MYVYPGVNHSWSWSKNILQISEASKNQSLLALIVQYSSKISKDKDNNHMIKSETEQASEIQPELLTCTKSDRGTEPI